MVSLSLWLVLAVKWRAVFLICAQETGGTVCIEMLSGCLYINPLRVNSFIRTPEGKKPTSRKLKKKKGLNRMVATTDCEEKSKPIAGHKVCRETSWKELDLTVFYWRVLCAILILPAFSLQVSKPLMEKKRRARINKSLDQLKSLLESYYSSNVRIQIWSCFYFRPTENAVNVIIVLIRRKLSE